MISIDRQLGFVRERRRRRPTASGHERGCDGLAHLHLERAPGGGYRLVERCRCAHFSQVASATFEKLSAAERAFRRAEERGLRASRLRAAERLFRP